MKILNRMEEIFCGTALLATTIILFVNVVLRYVFESSTSWAEELVKYLMIWITFIGASICVRRGAHVSIDFFYEYLSIKNKKIVAIIIHGIGFIFSCMMIFYGIKVINFIFNMGQVSPALQIPMWIPYLAIPLGFVLMAIGFIREIIKNIKGYNFDVRGVK
ncbi:TRAP transporter small permease [Crassaminicella profunda]|uniref:TRAP transporter small permease n=1 Tax=Crassaminicella profunda TaxID=1286698 RepID=UPI001CA712F3|nr:TRAP transporter small permease [Crassaminicella profunda]QZY53803.1 TRAP transporter small permease [Crassaminicella profunda]